MYWGSAVYPYGPKYMPASFLLDYVAGRLWLEQKKDKDFRAWMERNERDTNINIIRGLTEEWKKERGRFNNFVEPPVSYT